MDRSSVSKLKRDFDVRFLEHASNFDLRMAEGQTREPVRFIGTVIVEAYTPSNVRVLPKQIAKFPGASKMIRRTGAKEVLAGRGGSSRHTRQLGYITRIPNGPFGIHESDLSFPKGFGLASTWEMDFIPSLILVLTSFSVDESKTDLTDQLYGGAIVIPRKYRLLVLGPFGNIRRNIPWSRPKSYRHQTEEEAISVVRTRRISEIVEKETQRARTWFCKYFKGFLAEGKADERISYPFFATTSKDPFTSPEGSWPSGILDYDFNIWDSTNPVGWRLNTSDHFLGITGVPAIFAGRLDTIQKLGISESEDCSNERIMSEFLENNLEVIQWLAVLRILEIYADRLANLRDGRHKLRSIRSRLFRYSRLKRFLEGDALDIASITNEIRRRIDEPNFSKMSSPKYEQVVIPGSAASSVTKELESELVRNVHFRALTLNEDYENVIGNLRSATELRQSISIFRIQLLLLGITFATLVYTYLLWHGPGA